jgi:hypothetical protein
MYDSVNLTNFIQDDWDYLAAYVTGRYAQDLTQLRQDFPDARIWEIDVTGAAPTASIKDIETGDLSPADVRWIVPQHHQANPNELCRLYCNLETWPAVKAAVRALSPELRAIVRYWIANPTGAPHLVPGSDATQWGWFRTYDQSLVNLPTWGT